MSPCAFAQRRHAQAQHVEPVVQILAEAALRHRRFQVHMRGGEHAHVQLYRLARTHPHQGAFLQQTQQAGLGIERQVADLVEENRAAAGGLEMPDAPRICAGEGATLLAEQFGLHQVPRQRTAIDGDEGPLATLASCAPVTAKV